MQKESMAEQMPVNELQFVPGLLSVPKALNCTVEDAPVW